MLFQRSEKVFFQGIFVFNSIKCLGSKKYLYSVSKMIIFQKKRAKILKYKMATIVGAQKV